MLAVRKEILGTADRARADLWWAVMTGWDLGARGGSPQVARNAELKKQAGPSPCGIWVAPSRGN